MEALIYGLWAAVLAAIGSFIGVCYARIPAGKQVVRGASHCDKCGRKLRAFELIPIISYLMLGGRCRSCKEKIPYSCLILELTAVVTGMIPLFLYGLTMQGFAVSIAACVLLEIAVVDYKTMEISDVANLLIGGIGIVLMCIHGTYLSSIIGLFAVSLPFLVLALLKLMGMGDVKLMAAAGIFLGFPNVLCAAFFGIVAGSFCAVIQKISNHKEWKSEIAFGPYLCMGIYIAMLFGERILSLYLSLIQ